jgi:hypothetical protein
MQASIYGGETVKQGTFLYDGTVICDVRIVRTETRYGSGDHEDPPEIRDDRPGPCFYVEWGSTRTRGELTSGSGGYTTLSDAIRAVEQAVSGVRWTDEDST